MEMTPEQIKAIEQHNDELRRKRADVYKELSLKHEEERTRHVAVKAIATLIVLGLCLLAMYLHSEAATIIARDPLMGCVAAVALISILGVIWRQDDRPPIMQELSDRRLGIVEIEDDEEEEEEKPAPPPVSGKRTWQNTYGNEWSCKKCENDLEEFDPKPFCAACRHEVTYLKKIIEHSDQMKADEQAEREKPAANFSAEA